MHKENPFYNIFTKLQQAFPEVDTFLDEPMSRHTTFRVGGPADIYVEPPVDEVVPLLAFLQENQVPVTIVGNGSNLLVSDEGVEGAVVAFGKNASSILLEGNVIKAQAGAMLSTLAIRARDASLAGLEFAAGIPGTVGGAVYMNAGAYGGQIADIITSVRIITEDLQVKELTAAELELSYRQSSLMEKGGTILEATFTLKPGDKEAISQVMEANKASRIEKQPLNFPSAGSTFKRPEGYFAGKLIDDAGLRGYRVGDAQVSEKHCGFVINAGQATCQDILTLMADVDRIVFEKNGVHLEPEVRIIGRGIK